MNNKTAPVAITDEQIDTVADNYDLYGIQDGGRVSASTLREFARDVAALSCASQADIPAQPEGMPVSQEPKYGIRDNRLYNRASGEFIPLDEPVFIMRARDKKAMQAINQYAELCDDPDHKEAVSRRVLNFHNFSVAYPQRMKYPDTAPVSQAMNNKEAEQPVPPYKIKSWLGSEVTLDFLLQSLRDYSKIMPGAAGRAQWAMREAAAYIESVAALPQQEKEAALPAPMPVAIPKSWHESLGMTVERLEDDAAMYDRLGQNSTAEDRRARAHEIMMMFVAPVAQQEPKPVSPDGLLEKLQACVDDPMWPNHAEVSKATLAEIVAALKNVPDYEAMEREHLGDADKRTGIYHPDVIAAPQEQPKPDDERKAFETWWRYRFCVPDFVPLQWDKLPPNDEFKFEAFQAGRQSMSVQSKEAVK